MGCIKSTVHNKKLVYISIINVHFHNGCELIKLYIDIKIRKIEGNVHFVSQ